MLGRPCPDRTAISERTALGIEEVKAISRGWGRDQDHFLTARRRQVSLHDTMSANYPVFVKRDVDGFFGLFIDNLVQLLLIPILCSEECAAC